MREPIEALLPPWVGEAAPVGGVDIVAREDVPLCFDQPLRGEAGNGESRRTDPVVVVSTGAPLVITVLLASENTGKARRGHDKEHSDHEKSCSFQP